MVEKAVSPRPIIQPVHMPRALLEKQSFIMNKLMDHPDMITWDDDGRVTVFRNNYSPNSDIHALLHAVTTESRDPTFPHGYSSFENVLKMMNIPPNVFSKRLHTMLSSPKPASPPKIPADEFSTPTQALTLSSWRDIVTSPKVPQAAPPSKIPTPNIASGSSSKNEAAAVPPVGAAKPPPGRHSTPSNYQPVNFARNVNDRRGVGVKNIRGALGKPK